MSASHPKLRLVASEADLRPAAEGRHTGLDALRGAASLMVAALHAAVPYLLWPMPLLLWSARDAHPSPLVDAIGWSIQCCVMPTFFVLSGYFAAGLLAKLSPAKFYQHRRRRLLIPLIFGFSTVLPACLYIWIAGWVADGLISPRKLVTLKFDNPMNEHVWGLAHLWFLEYLFVYSAALAGIAACLERWPSPTLRAMAAGGWGWAVLGGLACAAAGVLWCDLAIVVGFQNTLAPVSTKLIYFSLFFTYGLWLRQRLQNASAAPRAPQDWGMARWLSAALVMVWLLPLVHQQQQQELLGWSRVALAGLLTCYAWLMADGLVRTAWHWRPKADSRLGRTLDYLAQASLWMYLAHLPVVGLLQLDLTNVPLPAVAKFALVTLGSWGIVLFLYQTVVRHTWVGALLDGRPAPRKAAVEPAGDRRPEQDRRAA